MSDGLKEAPQAGPTSAGPSSAGWSARSGLPVLRLVTPLAALAVATLILGRAVAPAAQGIRVGLGRLLRAVEITGATLSQIFAMGSIAVAVSAIFTASRTRLPYTLRVSAIALGGFVVLTSFWAARTPIPGVSAALIGVSASLLALVSAGTSFGAPFARGPALVLGLTAAASLLRLAAVALAYQAAEPGAARAAAVARGVATAAFAVDAVSLSAATAWIAAQSAWKRRAAQAPPSEPSPRKLTSPITVVILALSLLCTRQALIGAADDSGALNVLLWRTAERLMTRPDPAVPLGFRIFAAFLAPLVAVAAVATRGAIPALTSSVALILVARMSPEVPICALVLLIASLCVALASQDERGVWDALSARAGASSRR